MTLSRLLVFSSLFISSSCSYFIELDQSREKVVFKNLNKQVTCKQPSSFSIASQTGTNFSNIKTELFKISNQHNLKAIETFAVWALIQMYIRPEKVSPHSALQVLDTTRTKNDYFSFNAKKFHSALYLSSVRTLLKKYSSKKSLREIARYVDLVMTRYHLVDNDLGRTLLENRSDLMSNKRNRALYFKGQQVLREGEALKTYSMSTVVKSYKSKTIKYTGHLFENKLGPSTSVRCNFDIDIYKKGIYLIEPEGSDMSHPFSLSYKGKTFMAVASQRSNYKDNAKFTYSFIPKTTRTQKAFCKIKNSKNQFSIVSSKGRDSGQLLFNLFEYKISESQQIDEVIEILNFPRYMFLLGPKRMIYESGRSSSSQTQTFLDTGFPIYHMSSLGNIWLNYKTKKNNIMILDGRQDNLISCTK